MKKLLFHNKAKDYGAKNISFAYIVLIGLGIVYYFAFFIIFGLASSIELQIMYLMLSAVGIAICIFGLRYGASVLSQENLRQLRQPSEFRIDEITIPRGVKLDCATDASELCAAFETFQKTSTGKKSDTSSEGPAVSDFVLFNLCTEIWRLKKKVASEQHKGVLNESQIPRYIERIDMALESANLLIHDHSGERYLPGQAVKVISVQQCEDIPVGEERIIETIKPTIYRNGIVVKQGEVVIGTSFTNEQKTGD
jgi:hypothetical protein